MPNKQINKRNPMITSYAHGVAYITSSPVIVIVYYKIDFKTIKELWRKCKAIKLLYNLI